MTPGQRATTTRRFEPETLAAFSRLVGIDIGDTVPEPLIGALFMGGAAMVWAEDAGARSRREAMTIPTASDATMIRSE